ASRGATRLDAVVGYTQRFRRKWLAAKEKVRTGALGDVTLVTSRAFMNRLVAIDNYKRTNDPKTISPMAISGTHALDIVMWCMEAKTPVECPGHCSTVAITGSQSSGWKNP